MTRNFANEDQVIAVEGVDRALELAKVLLKNDYEVFVELDDCNIYCVHYSTAKYKHYGNAAFYRITQEQAEYLDSLTYADEEEEDE